MRIPRGPFLWGFLLVMANGRGVGSPLQPAVGPDGEATSSGRFAFQVSLPAVTLAGTPEGHTIQIEGFEARQASLGAPSLPTRIVRVAIPPGAAPRLTVRVLSEDRLPGIRPRPVPRIVADALEDPGSEAAMLGDAELRRRGIRREEAFEEDRAIYEGRAVYPETVAWLGETGVLRDQRYVEVHLAPVRFDPVARGLRVALRMELTVHFDGAAPALSQAVPDPRFESVYRDAFVNYAQGTAFRLSAAAARAPVSVSSSLGTEDVNARHRIRTSANGVVRLDYARMTGTGFLPESLATWKLTSNGVEVPLRVNDGNGNGFMDPGDWVQFYGQALDFDSKTSLTHDNAGVVDLYQAEDFTDENVYFLTVQAGTRARMAERPSAPGVLAPPADFEAIVHREVDDTWRPLGEADPWYWGPSQSNPQTSPPNALLPTRTESVELPGVVPTGSARVTVRLRGLSTDGTTYPDHRSRVTLRNASGQGLAQSADDGTFDGRVLYTHDFTWTYPGSGSTLTSPAQVYVEALAVSGAPGSYKNQLVLDWIEIRYRRTFAAQGSQLTFDWPDGDADFQVTGISDASPEVYELTRRVGATGIVDPVRLTGATASAGTVRFHVANDPDLPDGTTRRFVVLGSAAVTVPDDAAFSADTVSDLRSNANQADLIVIGHPGVLDTTPGGALDLWLALRASQGITSKVVRIADVEDEFNDGLPGPSAIRKFLEWVMSTAPGEGWAAPKPAFVVLLGDASYQYKGGTASGNYVPTWVLYEDDISLGYMASDNRMAAVLGTDLLADLVVGRIPAGSVAEANGILDKIRRYEATPDSATAWRRHALFVSDRGKTFSDSEAKAFEKINYDAEQQMKRPPHTSARLEYWSGTRYCNQTPAECDPEVMRQDIKDAVNGTFDASGGAAMMQFVGHGNFQVWSDDAFFAQGYNNGVTTFYDADDLANGLRLPWLLAGNCLTGGFETLLANSMGEDWLKNAGGGALAVLAPSWLSYTEFSDAVRDTVFDSLYGRRKERQIGVPVMSTLSRFCGQGSYEPCLNYVLLGDPSSNLLIPSVGAPTAVQATGGNRRVDLSWTASTTAIVTYDVYRTENPNVTSPAYTRVGTGIAGPAYPGTVAWADTSVTNATTYYYYVLAADAEGFESRWSNFNSDCPLDGPDCLHATPLNPNPPGAPTGLLVTDPETGGKLNLSWTARPADEEVAYYTVNYGTVSGTYTETRNAGKGTSYSLTGLTNGVPYYVAITATNTSGRTSAFGAEGSGVPTLVRGVRSPDFIDALHVDRSGTNAVLTWPAVTTDIYGKPTTVARYEVYRGTTPDFVPSVTNRIGQPTAATFTDAGAVVVGLPNYYYLVRAVDGAGNVGGLGNQLPNGIDTLTIAKVPASADITLSWPAVTTDFDGRPIQVDHYEIYHADHPFSRANIRDGAVPDRISPVTTTSYTLNPGSGNRYYSVLVVDRRGNVSSF